MTSKSVYQKFNDDALKYFGLESAPVYGVLSKTDTVEQVICTSNSGIYENIKETLLRETFNQNWKNYKRAFILPKCPVSIERIKANLKRNGIVVVNDYEKADFIITHDCFHKKLVSGDYIKSTLLLSKLVYYNYITPDEHCSQVLRDSNLNIIVHDSTMRNVRRNLVFFDSLDDEYMITGMSLNIAHALETNSLKDVVNVNTIMSSSNMTQDITEELIESIYNMVQSYNDDDIKIVGKILPTINLEKNHHLLWVLFNKIEYYMYKFKRNKDVQFWISNQKYPYTQINSENMIFTLEKDNLLDKESFKFLEPICRKDILIYNRNLYTFNVSIIPEFQKYLK